MVLIRSEDKPKGGKPAGTLIRTTIMFIKSINPDYELLEMMCPELCLTGSLNPAVNDRLESDLQL